MTNIDRFLKEFETDDFKDTFIWHPDEVNLIRKNIDQVKNLDDYKIQYLWGCFSRNVWAASWMDFNTTGDDFIAWLSSEYPGNYF